MKDDQQATERHKRAVRAAIFDQAMHRANRIDRNEPKLRPPPDKKAK